MKKGTKIEPKIYRTLDGTGFIAVANVPVLIKGRKRYRRPEKRCTNLLEARSWLKVTMAEATLGRLSKGEIVTLKRAMEITEPEKRRLKTWNNIRVKRSYILEYFGEEQVLENITRANLVGFQQYLSKRSKMSGSGTLSKPYIDLIMSELSYLLGYGLDEDWLPKKPKIPFFRKPNHRTLAIDLGDYLAIVGKVVCPVRKAMLLTALNTGLRKSELLTLKRNQIIYKNIWNHEHTLERVAFFSVSSLKTGVEHIEIPILNITLDAIKALPEHTDYLFPRKCGAHYVDQPYTALQPTLDKACKAAGVARFTTHIVRHLATTVLLDLTGDTHIVQKIIGWSNEAMVHHYGHIGVRHTRTFQKFDHLIQETVGSAEIQTSCPQTSKIGVTDAGSKETLVVQENRQQYGGTLSEATK